METGTATGGLPTLEVIIIVVVAATISCCGIACGARHLAPNKVEPEIVSVSTTRVSTKERAAVVEWKLEEIIGKIQLMKFTLLR